MSGNFDVASIRDSIRDAIESGDVSCLYGASELIEAVLLRERAMDDAKIVVDVIQALDPPANNTIVRVSCSDPSGAVSITRVINRVGGQPWDR